MSGRLYPYGRFKLTQQDRVPKVDKVIVLDIDETLVHTIDDNDQLDKLRDLRIFSDPGLLDIRSRTYIIDLRDDDGTPFSLWGIKRPYVDEFLRFCTDHFKHVCIWSAGTPDYVHAVTAELFKDLPQPSIIYTRKHCEGPLDDMYKPLLKMLKDEPMLKGYKLEDLYMLDDKRRTYRENKQCGVLMVAYNPETIDEFRAADTHLRKIQQKFLEMHSNTANADSRPVASRPRPSSPRAK